MTQKLLINSFSIFENVFYNIPEEGHIASLLFDSYSFSSEDHFLEPWYYSQDKKFFVCLRNSTDALYAAFKNEYDRMYWGIKFEDVINIRYINEIIQSEHKPALHEFYHNLHDLFERPLVKIYLDRWLKFFPAQNFYMIPNSEISNSKDLVISEISKILNIPDVKTPGKTVYGFPSPAFNFKPMYTETRRILDIFFDYYNQGVIESINRCNAIGAKDTLFKRVKKSSTIETIQTKPEKEFYETVVRNKDNDYTI